MCSLSALDASLIIYIYKYNKKMYDGINECPAIYIYIVSYRRLELKYE